MDSDLSDRALTKTKQKKNTVAKLNTHQTLHMSFCDSLLFNHQLCVIKLQIQPSFTELSELVTVDQHMDSLCNPDCLIKSVHREVYITSPANSMKFYSLLSRKQSHVRRKLLCLSLSLSLVHVAQVWTARQISLLISLVTLLQKLNFCTLCRRLIVMQTETT